jgi:hypothetical protein
MFRVAPLGAMMFRVAPLGAMMQLINRASKFRAHFAPKGATLNFNSKLRA